MSEVFEDYSSKARALIISDLVYLAMVNDSQSLVEYLTFIVQSSDFHIDNKLKKSECRVLGSNHSVGKFSLIYKIINYKIYYKILAVPNDWGWSF